MHIYTQLQLMDLAQSIADYRRYGFTFEEAYEKVVHGNRVHIDNHAVLRILASRKWGRIKDGSFPPAPTRV